MNWFVVVFKLILLGFIFLVFLMLCGFSAITVDINNNFCVLWAKNRELVCKFTNFFYSFSRICIFKQIFIFL